MSHLRSVSCEKALGKKNSLSGVASLTYCLITWNGVSQVIRLKLKQWGYFLL
jgi:hypothetical protein